MWEKFNVGVRWSFNILLELKAEIYAKLSYASI